MSKISKKAADAAFDRLVNETPARRAEARAVTEDLEAATAAIRRVLVEVFQTEPSTAEMVARAFLFSVLERLGKRSEVDPLDRMNCRSGTRKLVEAVHVACMTVCQGGRYDWLTERGQAVLQRLRDDGVRPVPGGLL